MNPIFTQEKDVSGWTIAVKEPRQRRPWYAKVEAVELVEKGRAKIGVQPRSYRGTFPGCIDRSVRLINCVTVFPTPDGHATESGGYTWRQGRTIFTLTPPPP